MYARILARCDAGVGYTPNVFDAKKHEQDVRVIHSVQEEEWFQSKNQLGNWQRRVAG
jgi:hypothetical protein